LRNKLFALVQPKNITLLGENGTGKSTVLQALAIMLAGPEGANQLLKPEILNKKQVEWQSGLNKAISEYQNDNSPANRKKLDVAFCKYNHKQVKDSLKIMFSGKCAYCESHITHIGFGHIEHFRPKSKFPELCFEWDNLLLGCEICNGKYKGDKFPESNEGGPFIN